MANNYREYVRIRPELREKCKAEYNKNWKDKITNIINSKYTNYFEDKDKNRYYTNREKCNIMEKTWRDIF